MQLSPNFSITVKSCSDLMKTNFLLDCWEDDTIQHTTTVSFEIMGRCFELKTLLIKLQKKSCNIFLTLPGLSK